MIAADGPRPGRASPSRCPGLVEAEHGNAAARAEPRLVRDRRRRRARRPDARVPVRADNEANLAALAEHWQGVARDLENFICVFGEVGVGRRDLRRRRALPRRARFRRRVRPHHRRPRRPARASAARPAASRRSSARRRSPRRAGISRRRGRPRAQRHRGARAARGAGRSGCDPGPLPKQGRYLGIGLALGGEPVRRRRRRARRLLRPARPLARRRRPRASSRERVLSSAWSRCEVRAVGVRRGRRCPRGGGADSDVRAGRAVARRGACRRASARGFPDHAISATTRGLLSVRPRAGRQRSVPERTTKEVSTRARTARASTLTAEALNRAESACSVARPHINGTSPGGEPS